MSEKQAAYPDFRCQLDPDDLPEADNRVEAGRRFNQTFDRWVRGHRDCFKSYNDNGRLSTGLVRKVDLPSFRAVLLIQTSQLISGAGVDKDLRPSEDVRRSISLQLFEADQRLGFSSYRLGPDGVVRRYDVDAQTDLLSRLLKTQAKSAGGQTEAGMCQLNDQNNARQNVRLGEDMGVNNQSVSAEEIAGLSKFLDKSAQERTVVCV